MRTKSQFRLMGFLAAAALLVWANSIGWTRPLTGLVGRVLEPVGAVFAGSGSRTGNFFRTLSQVKDLASDNSRLEQQLADARQQLATDAELRQQNEALRRQLNFGDVEQQPLIPAEVVGYQPDNFRSFMSISRGSKDGVKEGMAVISEGSLVGRVSEVSDTSAKVQLVMDPDFRVNGIDQETRASGTVHGQVGSGMVMDKIAQSDSIKAGDIVITSGLGGGLPKGIIIGQVESVNQQDNAVFQTALVVSSLHFTKLELVFVVDSP